jgi:hypothetical protein
MKVMLYKRVTQSAFQHHLKTGSNMFFSKFFQFITSQNQRNLKTNQILGFSFEGIKV